MIRSISTSAGVLARSEVYAITSSNMRRSAVHSGSPGYGLFGAVEEITDAQLRDQLEVDLLGPLRVVQAALPILREQGSAHIIQISAISAISSISGVAALPNIGGYPASKFALEGLSDSLDQEVAPFGNAAAQRVPDVYRQRLDTWTEWSRLTSEANG